jgi:SAM-dependent methyltransferase
MTGLESLTTFNCFSGERSTRIDHYQQSHAMTNTADNGTIDWDRFWREADAADRDSATPSTHHVRGLLSDLFIEKGVPESFADVGCGPGVVTFHIAEQHPEMTVAGYDAAESILAENRQRTSEDDIENARFEQTILPAFEPGRQFDLVLCFGTLGLVGESEYALQHLYDAVAPGGHLVVGYTNRRGRAHYQRLVESPEKHPNPDFDAERFAERFRLVLDGASTLSYRQIHDALGTCPRSFWEFIEQPEERWAWDHVPLVWVPK